MSDETQTRILWGYRQIGAAVGRGEAWALRWSREGQDRRIPVVWVGRRPMVSVADLQAWLASWASSTPER